MDANPSWRALLEDATQRLRSAGLPSAEVDARRITEEASGAEGAALLLQLDDVPSERAAVHFRRMLDRRSAGEPLQYVLGRWGFRTLDLMVDRRVLIPRPETEQVVEHALAELDRVGHSRRNSGPRRAAIASRTWGDGATAVRKSGWATVADLGSGSGAIGLSIAAERPCAAVWCVDASAPAVAVTRANLAGLGIAGAGVTVVEGSWFEALPDELRGALDLVVTNPPYVAASDALPSEVADWEPVEALIAGSTGLEAIEQIIADAPDWLAADGVLVAEIGETQAAAVTELAAASGFAEVDVRADLAGRDRVMVARRR